MKIVLSGNKSLGIYIIQKKTIPKYVMSVDDEIKSPFSDIKASQHHGFSIMD